MNYENFRLLYMASVRQDSLREKFVPNVESFLFRFVCQTQRVTNGLVFSTNNANSYSVVHLKSFLMAKAK